MLRITYDEIIRRIKEEKGVSDSDINFRIEAKLKQLSGLVSREGAAHIVANELGLKLFPDINKKRFKVKELVEGLRVNELVAKVTRKFEVHEFKTQSRDGQPRDGKVASFFVADETGTTRIVLWENSHISAFESFSEGDIIKFTNGLVKENRGFKEVHLGGRSELFVNPPGEEVNVSVQSPKIELKSKKIVELAANDFVKVMGTIVQLFEPRFYDACPECNRKVLLEADKFRCEQHGHVIPKSVPIVNLSLDDSTDNVRVVLFRELAPKVFGLEDISVLKGNTVAFEEVKKSVLGKVVSVSGRVSKNDMFDRFEIVAQDISEVNPVELAASLAASVEGLG